MYFFKSTVYNKRLTVSSNIIGTLDLVLISYKLNTNVSVTYRRIHVTVSMLYWVRPLACLSPVWNELASVSLTEARDVPSHSTCFGLGMCKRTP